MLKLIHDNYKTFPVLQKPQQLPDALLFSQSPISKLPHLRVREMLFLENFLENFQARVNTWLKNDFVRMS